MAFVGFICTCYYYDELVMMANVLVARAVSRLLLTSQLKAFISGVRLAVLAVMRFFRRSKSREK